MGKIHEITAPGFDLNTNEGVRSAVENGGLVISKSPILREPAPASPFDGGPKGM